ncbi:hypothetical protein H2198_005666 [Neophaeococcomyces mojaviensis]|uniref:Uncharacterized protein n=1 Tax=Neophaeococcomyces mojaviensis TaxID=3383035 RepID=A0ACC3A509_9EURO|nr:hypothetical protein H2198_005666 [Knufia sp. JES_112]
MSAMVRNLVLINTTSRYTSAISSRLITGVKEDSETLQDINDQFCPLMSRFRCFFFWEQEKTLLKSTSKRDYIVPETSAAPILDNTERCGIAADHANMCRFNSPKCQGFRDIVSALRRYRQEAPAVVAARVKRSEQILLQQRHDEAMELISSLQSPKDTALDMREDFSQPDMRRLTVGYGMGQLEYRRPGHDFAQINIYRISHVHMGDQYNAVGG